MTKAEDKEFRDVTITKVEPQGAGEGWAITSSDGWSFFVPDKGVEPRVGDAARFYGRGIGSIVRGLDIRGFEVFYRTPEEQEEQNRQDIESSAIERREDFERKRESLDADYGALPSEFQQRLDGFRERNPNFRVEYESYEMMCCREAVKIAAACPTEKEVKAFWSASHEKQKEILPNMENGHSGNSFGASCGLALLYVTQPELVAKQHGALCPLVGCDDYGCYSTVAQAA